jgi:uncharacterized protein YhhL (DUF1145 family)
MDLISLVVILIIIGVLLYLINSVIPMDGNIKKIINVVVIIVVCIWVMQQLGLLGSLGAVSIR